MGRSTASWPSLPIRATTTDRLCIMLSMPRQARLTLPNGQRVLCSSSWGALCFQCFVLMVSPRHVRILLEARAWTGGICHCVPTVPCLSTSRSLRLTCARMYYQCNKMRLWKLDRGGRWLWLRKKYKRWRQMIMRADTRRVVCTRVVGLGLATLGGTPQTEAASTHV